jgi:UDP-N-acetylmuramoyl-L-alanyl-D-glutamate--2,6-diaminopimelate ligase
LQRSGAKYSTEPDRRTGIQLALNQARAGDIVLIAGKGHEKIQVSRGGAAPFDDRQVAAEVLRDMGYDCEKSGAKKTA